MFLLRERQPAFVAGWNSGWRRGWRGERERRRAKGGGGGSTDAVPSTDGGRGDGDVGSFSVVVRRERRARGLAFFAATRRIDSQIGCFVARYFYFSPALDNPFYWVNLFTIHFYAESLCFAVYSPHRDRDNLLRSPLLFFSFSR